MPDQSTIVLFCGAAFLLLVIPGPAVFYIVARSIDQGRRAGVVSTIGIGVGTFVHVVAAALGISAVLVSSALAFNVVKYLGAGYLIFLGLKTLLTPEQVSFLDKNHRPQKLTQVFYQGVLVNLLNPKTALFFFAFMPQFVDPSKGSVAGQIVFFGSILVTMGVLSDGAYALTAGTLGNWLRKNGRVLRTQKYFAGTVYILLGLATAISGSNKK